MVPELEPDDGVTVVLVHGLYMGPWAMGYLGRRIAETGFATVRFSYATLHASLPDSADSLAGQLEALCSDSVHFVGHSLGGLLIRHLFHRYPEQRPGRVVTLGTPHQGSYVARWMSAHGPLGQLLGRSAPQGSLGDAPPWAGSHDLGVVAGSRHLGLGQLVPGLPRPNDGTVSVEETRLKQAKDHIVLPVTHTSLLFSPTVAEQTLAFLNTGRFLHGH